MAAQTRASPFINERYLDVPTQRLLAVGVLAAVQAMKIGAFATSLTDYNDVSGYKLLFKWCIVDATLLWLIPLLRIPRLSFDTRARTAQIMLFCFLNWVLFGNYALSLGHFVPVSIRGLLSIFEYDELAISQRRVKIQEVVDYGSHLLGQHTVRLSPISKARLNPENLPFCLASPAIGVFIPILLNNTKSPSFISYSVAALADQGPRTYINVTSRELKKMQSVAASLIAEQEKLHGTSFYDIDEDEDDEFDIDDGTKALTKRMAIEDRKRKQQSQLILPSSTTFSRSLLKLEATQKLVYLRITRPGLIRLEKVLDQNNADTKIPRRPGQSFEATVVECPSSRWGEDAKGGTLCASSGAKDVSIHVRGTVPMTLKWHHIGAKGAKEDFVVEGIKGSTEADGFPLAQEVRIPLTLRLDNPGTHVYSLDSLTDGSGNTIDLIDASRAFSVLGRSSVSFRGCGTGPDKTLSLLQGRTTQLLVSLNEVDTLDAPWTARVRYDPPLGLESKSGKAVAQSWTRDFVIPSDKKTIAIDADKAGDYSLVSISGNLCPGEVLSPETCRVVEQPIPTAEIEFKSIHECASDTGVTAIAILHGAPPFVLYYTIKHDRNPPKTVSKTFNSQRAEIVLKPERSGTYTYTFSHLTDKHYAKVPLQGTPTTTQQVHPLAVAQFVGRGSSAGNAISNCEGQTVDFELDLRGSPPFTVEVQIVGPQGSEVKTFSNLKGPKEKIQVPILEDLDRSGGIMEVDLVSVEDATGCKRPLEVPGAVINVKRVKPTVKFYYPEGKQDVLKLLGETAILPLRLTGDGPWEVTYGRNMSGDVRADAAKRLRISSANEKIPVDAQGIYELLSVRDTHCPGVVVPEAATYQVNNVQKPAGVFNSNAGEMTSSGAIIRRPVCVAVDDYADIDLEGRPPFQVRYSYSGQFRGRDRAEDHETFNSIQKTSRLQLRTSEPGHHEYHLTDFGDAAYPLPHRVQSSPRYSGTVLQQEVLSRPSAYFKSSKSSPYCLNQKLEPRSGHSDDPVVVLTGKAPFKLTLNIKNVATSESRLAVVDVTTPEWKVDIPTYKLQTVGPHLITIESFEDSSPCSPSAVDYERRTFRIDVAETAAIVPFDRRADWCVGDLLQFQLEGNAPWKIDYRFNGKPISANSKIPKFTRVAEQSGIFEITGVAHQQASCQSEVSDVKLTIHDLPSARVSHGNNVYEDLREGDQAEILFSLIGTPPFTFTYQRASLERPKGVPDILETHTVSGVMSNEYSIFSALEGTWTVTFIADKYCRYPPAPQRAGDV